MSEKGRRIAGCTLMAAAVLTAAAALFPLPSKETAAFSAESHPADKTKEIPVISGADVLNSGNTDELALLPGIGPVLASMVYAEREENGKFHYPEDITAVKGIGMKKMEQLIPYMTTVTGESEE